MQMNLRSDPIEVDNYRDAMELFHERGWTDGLPVVPPTPDSVEQFLAAAQLEPSYVVGEMPERSSKVTAEKLAINAVMAGCLPSFMPILVAAVEAVADEGFRFNHLASLGSPWPLLIVNGPVVQQVSLNSGGYLFGPGARANVSIARALSLVLANCALARSGGIQRGQWGHPGRWSACIAENEDTDWDPLHVQRGMAPTDSAVTAVSAYPNLPTQIATLITTPERMLDAVCHSISGFGGAQWIRGMYTLMVSPHHVDIFSSHGWNKDDVREYIRQNTRASIADLKTRGQWGTPLGNLTAELQRIEPGDHDTYMYLFSDNGQNEEFLHSRADVDGREIDVMVVVAGGDAGHRLAVAVPYSTATNPVTKQIRIPGS